MLAGFVAAAAAALALAAEGGDWLTEVDQVLKGMEWAITAAGMWSLVEQQRARGTAGPAIASPAGLRDTGRYDVMIVGAGFAGAVMAERLANAAGKRVLVVDRRPHVGGNAYDRLDAADLLIHQYGPHIFHTNSAEIFGHLSRFTTWRPYEHRVLAQAEQDVTFVGRLATYRYYKMDQIVGQALATFRRRFTAALPRLTTATATAA